MALNLESIIHFRKTNSTDFANEFPEFALWLYKRDDYTDEYINIINVDGAVTLSPTREREFPILNITSTEGKPLANGIYFLDDIKVIYYRGVPYDSVSDYITTAEYADEIDAPTPDPTRHVLLLPRPKNSNGTQTVDDLSVAYIHQLDDNGVYNANLKDASITVFVKGNTSGKTFTIKQSMVAGSVDDATDKVSYWGLKNYIDSKLKGLNVEEVIDTDWKFET